MSLIDAARQLREAHAGLPERAPMGQIAYILNPLEYAWENHKRYLELYGSHGQELEAVFLGMNPGPFGMAQTGVPFGSPDLVKAFLKIDGPVDAPLRQHPKRPILGVDSPRNEVSGQRIWGAVRDRFGSPEAFFKRFFVANYCPLVFQSSSGANLTPNKLPRELWQEVNQACIEHLIEVLAILRPQTLIGVGKWAEAQGKKVLESSELNIRLATILHPSPASPAANRGWREIALRQLEELGHPWPSPPLL